MLGNRPATRISSEILVLFAGDGRCRIDSGFGWNSDAYSGIASPENSRWKSLRGGDGNVAGVGIEKRSNRSAVPPREADDETLLLCLGSCKCRLSVVPTVNGIGNVASDNAEINHGYRS